MADFLTILDTRRRLCGALSVAVLLAITPVTLQAAVFTVDNAADVIDATPGDGVCATAGAVCTLRAATEETNARWPGPIR